VHARVSAVVVHEDGRLLLGQRSDNGPWTVVSGIPEPGEQPALAVVREKAEETGIDAVGGPRGCKLGPRASSVRER
jgi:8-oxo-dGTP pyrophosphatase MutT (NUDIX family)